MLKQDADHPDVEVDVLLISTYDADGAGIFAHQLLDTLCEIGLSTRMVCLNKHSERKNVHGILDNNFFLRVIYRLRQEFDRRFFRPKPEYAFIHFSELGIEKILSSDVWPKKCRLIICTFISGMMPVSALITLKKRYGDVPLIFYGVDMNLYTGGCHYSQDCNGYLVNCSNCLAVPKLFKNRVAKNFDLKKNAYRKITPLFAVASSHQQYQEMINSTVFKSANLKKILMAVDESQFGKYEAKRMSLRVGKNFKKRVLLIRSSSEPRKGCDLFIKAVHSIYKDNPHFFDDVTLLSIGDQYIATQLYGYKLNIYSPGYISDKDELSSFYAMADVFLMTSYADSGPVMLAQSLMSGTPVITTDVGMARDVVLNKEDGVILNCPSEIVLKNAILSFFEQSDDSIYADRIKIRAAALAKFSKKIYAKNLAQVTDEIFHS